MSADKYPTSALRDICQSVEYGYTASASTEPVGPHFLRITDIASDRLSWEEVPFCKIDSNKHSKYCLRTGDIAIARTGATTGWAKFIKNPPDAVFASYLIRICPKPSVDARYVGFVVESQSYKEFIQKHIGGAAQPNANAQILTSFPLPIPPLSIQRCIADILSAYDDLIENNLRRIKILEDMACLLYHEWFVEFRFPGHEQVRIVDSELGRIPEGWEVVAFTEIADVLSGGTPKTTISGYWNGDIPFFAPKDAPPTFYVTTTDKKITSLGLSKCNSKLYPKDTAFITARGTVGKVVMPSINMAMNQSCYALRGREEINQLYLFLTARNNVEYLKKNTGGATFDTIVIDTFRLMKVVKPAVQLLTSFEKIISPLFELMLNLIQRNTNLRTTRDLLLPRLLSGQLDLSTVKYEHEEIAA